MPALYQCKICHDVFDTIEDAIECAKSHMSQGVSKMSEKLVKGMTLIGHIDKYVDPYDDTGYLYNLEIDAINDQTKQRTTIMSATVEDYIKITDKIIDGYICDINAVKLYADEWHEKVCTMKSE